MSAPGHGVLIAGGGLAALRCAETLRKRGYEGSVRMICAETEAPYDRPPLSKDLGSASEGDDAARLRKPDWYLDNAIELILGRRAIGLDPATRTLALDDGRVLGYDELLIATGAGARSLPMLAGHENAFPLRTIADARRLRSEMCQGARLTIVGAGFIGQEVAAAARGIGVEVTIVEALELPLVGILGPEVGRWLVDMHSEEGVRMRLGARLTAIHGNGRVEELELATGERIGSDVVVVGVGVSPAADWLEGSGLDSSGVRTDPAGRTELPHVYAAGDVARPFDERLRDHVRTEHWDAASRQGVAAATAMLGDEPRRPPLPSFWSDQYGLRIQYVGHAEAADEVHLDGDPAGRDFSALYLRTGQPVAGLAVGRPRELAAMRRRIETFHEEEPTTKETI